MLFYTALYVPCNTIRELYANVIHFPLECLPSSSFLILNLFCLQGEFVEDGTETHFTLGDMPAYIKAVTSGKRREGIIHSLIVNNTVIPEANER